MGGHPWTKLWVLALGVSLAQSAWGANPDPFEHATKTVNETAARLPGPQPVAGRIASELNAACACTRFSDESVAQQRARTGWGWGEVLIANRLALAISRQSNTTFATALGQVTTARQTMGWGAIAKANDLNLGRLVSDVTKSANAVASTASGFGKGQGSAAKGGPGPHGGGGQGVTASERGGGPAGGGEHGGGGHGSGGGPGGNEGHGGGAGAGGGSGGGGGGGGGGKK